MTTLKDFTDELDKNVVLSEKYKTHLIAMVQSILETEKQLKTKKRRVRRQPPQDESIGRAVRGIDIMGMPKRIDK